MAGPLSAFFIAVSTRLSASIDRNDFSGGSGFSEREFIEVTGINGALKAIPARHDFAVDQSPLPEVNEYRKTYLSAGGRASGIGWPSSKVVTGLKMVSRIISALMAESATSIRL